MRRVPKLIDVNRGQGWIPSTRLCRAILRWSPDPQLPALPFWEGFQEKGFSLCFIASQGKPEVLWQLAGVIPCWDQPAPGTGIPGPLAMYCSRCTKASRERAASRLPIRRRETTHAESLEMCYFMAAFNSDILEVNLLGSYQKIPIFSRATGTPRLKEKTANGFAGGEAAFAGSAAAKNGNVQKLDRV